MRQNQTDISRHYVILLTAARRVQAWIAAVSPTDGPHVLYYDEFACVLLWNRYANSQWAPSRIVVATWTGAVVRGYGNTASEALEAVLAELAAVASPELTGQLAAGNSRSPRHLSVV